MISHNLGGKTHLSKDFRQFRNFFDIVLRALRPRTEIMPRSLSYDSLLVAVRRFSVSAFAASTLLLVACGGGASGGTDLSRLQDKSPVENGSQASGGQKTVESDNNSEAPADTVESDSPVSEESGTESVSGSTADEEPSSDETDVVEQEPEPTVEDEVAVEDELAVKVDGLVLLQWDRPEFRENGEYLEGDEIDGYELRYRQVGEESFQSVIVDDGWTEEHEIGTLEGSYQFSIAAYDINGLYSEFVSLAPISGLVN